MKTLLNILIQIIWCGPQNILGLFVFLFTKLQKARTEIYKNTLVTRWKYSSGLSLGSFIFVSENDDGSTLKHEYGHYLDSNCIGANYLLVIGLPSLCWAIFGKKYRIKHGLTYYDFYTERRAELLGETNKPL